MTRSVLQSGTVLTPPAGTSSGPVVDSQLPVTAQAATLNATYVPKWQPLTAYTAGYAVLSPTGDIVTAATGFTSGASFNAADWLISTSYEQAGNAAAFAIIFGG